MIDPKAPGPPPPPASSDGEKLPWTPEAERQKIADANRQSFDAAQAWADAHIPPWATPEWHPQKPGR